MGATTDIFTSKYAVTITAILVTFGALATISQQKQGSLSFTEAQNIDYDTSSQIIDSYNFELPQVFSFGADGAVNPDERVTYETGVKYNADSSYCQNRDSDYLQNFAVWLEGEGLSNGETAWINQGKHSVWINCDGTFKDVSISINAPQTVGEYDYKLKTAPDNFLTQYPMFDQTSHWAGSEDTLEVKEPVTQPTSKISLSTHSAEIGDSISVSTQSTGDITEETLSVIRDGEEIETIHDFDESQQTTVDIDEAGEYKFELKTFYDGDNFYQDTDTATVNVEGYKDVEADIDIDASNTVEKGDEISLDASGSSGEGSLSYTWYVNSEEIGFGESTDYTVDEAGQTLAVELEVEDSVGQIDTSTDSITVKEASNDDDNNNDDDDDQNNMKTVFVIDGDNCVEQQVAQDVVLDPSFEDRESCESYLENQEDDDNDNDNDDEDDDDSKGIIEKIIEFLKFWE